MLRIMRRVSGGGESSHEVDTGDKDDEDEDGDSGEKEGSSASPVSEEDMLRDFACVDRVQKSLGYVTVVSDNFGTA